MYVFICKSNYITFFLGVHTPPCICLTEFFLLRSYSLHVHRSCFRKQIRTFFLIDSLWISEYSRYLIMIIQYMQTWEMIERRWNLIMYFVYGNDRIRELQWTTGLRFPCTHPSFSEEAGPFFLALRNFYSSVREIVHTTFESRRFKSFLVTWFYEKRETL